MNSFRWPALLFAFLASISALPRAYGDSELIFPQIADGGGYRTVLLLVNRSATPTTVKVEFTGSTGAPLSLPVGDSSSSAYSVELAAYGSVRLQTAGSAEKGSAGWARVSTSPVAEISGNAVFQLWHGNSLITETSVSASRPTTSAVFFSDEDAGFNTGVALANPGTNRALGLLTLRNSAGKEIGTWSFDLGAGCQQARYLSELLNSAQTGRAEISMQSGSVAATALRLRGAELMTAVTVATPSPILISGSCSDIQRAINSLPSTGGEIIVQAGTYICKEPLLIDQNNVSLIGQGAGTILRLDDGINKPLLVIGQTITPPLVARQNIRVANLMLDGNREKQTVECWDGPCGNGGHSEIRNNGITLRKVEDVTIENVTVKSARSGGLVAEKGCRRLMIKGFTSYDNHYDGLAGYETEDSTFTDLNLHDNLAAGISLDINFNNNVLSGGALIANRKQGVFMRTSQNNTFSAFQIRKNGEQGIFLAQVDTDASTPAIGNSFSGMVITNSGTVYADAPDSGQATAAGIRINNISCTNNILCSSQMIGNKGGNISEEAPGLLQTCGNQSR
jgi:hypothetical protein